MDTTVIVLFHGWISIGARKLSCPLDRCMAQVDAPAGMGAHNVSFEIYIGALAATVPFILGASEFVKRIVRPGPSKRSSAIFR